MWLERGKISKIVVGAGVLEQERESMSSVEAIAQLVLEKMYEFESPISRQVRAQVITTLQI